jgi:hypothetical protein
MERGAADARWSPPAHHALERPDPEQHEEQRMYPTHSATAASDKQARRRRRITRPLVVAISASLLGVSAVATPASGATDGSHQSAAGDAVAAAQNAGLVQDVQAVDVTGTPQFAGQFTLERFKSQQGVLYAVGRLEGMLGERFVSKRVSWPVTGAAASEVAGGPQGFAAPQQVPTPGACSILTLTLGPLDLNLLGLRVALNQVNLLIEAIPDPGNLLGNLLCTVAGLLDGGLGGGPLAGLLTSITNLLNAILAGL